MPFSVLQFVAAGEDIYFSPRAVTYLSLPDRIFRDKNDKSVW
jgi:hypothetical protein